MTIPILTHRNRTSQTTANTCQSLKFSNDVIFINIYSSLLYPILQKKLVPECFIYSARSFRKKFYSMLPVCLHEPQRACKPPLDHVSSFNCSSYRAALAAVNQIRAAKRRKLHRQHGQNGIQGVRFNGPHQLSSVKNSYSASSP